jgi:hypothetical protein
MSHVMPSRYLWSILTAAAHGGACQRTRREVQYADLESTTAPLHVTIPELSSSSVALAAASRSLQAQDGGLRVRALLF